MRLAVLTNEYPPHARGGAAVIADIQVQELERRGHEVRVFEHVPGFLYRPAIVRLFFHLADFWPRSELVKSILDWKPEVLITHNLTGCGFATPRAVQAMGVRWIHVLHDVQLVEPSGQIINLQPTTYNLQFFWRWFWSRTRHSALGTPNAVVSPTKWLLDFHEQYGFFQQSDKKVIPNPLPAGVGAHAMRPRSQDQSTRQEGEGAWHAPLHSILYVGRLSFDKGVDVLLAAWQGMGDDRPALTLVGDGLMRADLEKTAKDDSRLSVIGPEPHERVLERMRESDIVVVPSRVTENQPTVILEALAAGCRVVATDVGGIPETLGGAGWIVRAGDVEGLRGALKTAMENPGERALHEEKRQRILQMHNLQSVMNIFEIVLTTLSMDRPGEAERENDGMN